MLLEFVLTIVLKNWTRFHCKFNDGTIVFIFRETFFLPLAGLSLFDAVLKYSISISAGENIDKTKEFGNVF